ncbi:MAG: ribosome maturation factor [Treponema sp.]|nr:ribosome maturation factor [Treponema sp.]
MEYIPFSSLPYYSDCAPLVEGLGFRLLELKIVPAKTVVKISAVIASPDPSVHISVEDCSKVHHALQPRLEALLGTEETAMELTSPGIDRNIKNAAEFALFVNCNVRVWCRSVSDWVKGVLLSSTDKELKLKTEEGEKTILYEDIAKAKLTYNE